MRDELALSAVELERAYRDGAVSPVEACRAALARMDTWEPVVHAAWIRLDDKALESARSSERRWLRGRELGPLDGVPVTLKENVASRGVPIALGTAATKLVPAAADAPAAARLREAGAVLLAKTTMPDYGMLSSGVSSLHRTTRNPWNPAWTPGGSSSGAAAAAAAGYAPINIGTDIGGSIRLPAGWSGVVGFKPSFGRVPVSPPYYARAAGPLTRTVADAARAMAVLSMPDERDHMSLPFQALGWNNLAFDLHGTRFALLLDAGAGLPLDPQVAEAVRAAATLFEQAGAAVDPVAPLLTPAMLAGIDRFWQMRSHLELGTLEPERRARVLPFIRDWAAGAAELSGAQVFEAFSQMDAIAVVARTLMREYAFVLSPVAPVAAFAADLPSPTDDPRGALEHIGFTVPFSMSGQPAVSVPATMLPDGRPIGLQIAGRRFADVKTLAAAALFEQLRPPLPAYPDAPPQA